MKIKIISKELVNDVYIEKGERMDDIIKEAELYMKKLPFGSDLYFGIRSFIVYMKGRDRICPFCFGKNMMYAHVWYCMDCKNIDTRRGM